MVDIKNYIENGGYSQVNKMEQPKEVMEPKKASEWKRTTFDFHNGKAWCYRKMEIFKTETWSSEDLRPKGYYCATPTCKNELVFKWKDNNYRDNEPFKFHKALIKVLEKKDDDWKTGRKTHTYYAFCCKCAKLKHGDSGKVFKNKFTKKLMEFDIEPCDCASFIEDKKREATQAINNYNSMIKDCEELIIKVEGLRDKKDRKIYTEEKKTFKDRRLDDFISQLNQRRNDAITNKNKEENYLLLYNEWETKRNQQLENIRNYER